MDASQNVTLLPGSTSIPAKLKDFSLLNFMKLNYKKISTENQEANKF